MRRIRAKVANGPKLNRPTSSRTKLFMPSTTESSAYPKSTPRSPTGYRYYTPSS